MKLEFTYFLSSKISLSCFAILSCETANSSWSDCCKLWLLCLCDANWPAWLCIICDICVSNCFFSLSFVSFKCCSLARRELFSSASFSCVWRRCSNSSDRSSNLCFNRSISFVTAWIPVSPITFLLTSDLFLTCCHS